MFTLRLDWIELGVQTALDPPPPAFVNVICDPVRDGDPDAGGLTAENPPSAGSSLKTEATF